MNVNQTKIRIAFGFAPWIAQGLLSAPLGAAGAAAGALALAMVPVGYDLPRGRVKILEAATAGWFAVLLATSLAGMALPADRGPAIAAGVLALIAGASLILDHPFTEQYAREEWPEALWRDPRFRAVNRVITGLWGVIFVLDVIFLTGFGDQNWPHWAAAILTAAGAVASGRLPPLLARRAIRQRLAEQEPQPWPLPDLAAPRPAGTPWDATVIGAGIGGLAAAALLAKRGKRVLVAEAHDRPGGYCSQWTRTLGPRTLPKLGTKGSFTFDAGVHDISGLHERGGIRALLRHLGLESRIEWLPMTHEVILPEGRVTLGHGREALVAALGPLHPDSTVGIDAFLAEMERVFHDMYGEVEHTNGIPRGPRDVDLLMRWPMRHPAAFRWMEQSFQAMLAHYVADPTARRSLSLLTGYISDRAESLTVARMAPIIGMLLVGGHYPKGGSQTLADTLVAFIREHGGEVRLETRVERILVEDGVAAGLVLADGTVERSRIVIGGGDTKRTLLDLVGRDAMPAAVATALDQAEPACSAFMVTLAVDMVPQGPPLKHIRAADGKGVGIMIPSLVDPTIAPPGHAAVTLLELVPQAEATQWVYDNETYAEMKRARGDALIARAETAIPGLAGHIRYRQDASPRSFERYDLSSGGAIYGLAVGGWRPHRLSPVRNLFLTGAGTAIGAGVEAVAISGMLVAEDLGAFA